MTKRISFTVKGDTCGDVSKAIIKMIEKHYPIGSIANIMYAIEEHFNDEYFIKA